MIDEVERSCSPAATSRASAARGPAHVSAASDPARPAATAAGAAHARPRPRAAADGDPLDAGINTGPPPAVWDLAIVGGGPAGAIAAWRAAHLGLRVVLLERG
ncbi:MAG: FAD-dependent oxidoreductase, partial [Terriglobales bacterium]